MPRILKKLKNLGTIILAVIRNIVKGRTYPPALIPLKLLNRYTMNWSVKLGWYYLDDSYSSDKPRIYTKEQIDFYMEKVRNREVFYYGETDSYLYQALEKYSIDGKSVAIIGSVIPFYESICLYYGGKPTTIEYNRIISEDDRLTVLTVEEYRKTPILFDSAFSISSFEHSRLGRYGDNLNPEGDLMAMHDAKRMLKPDGTLFLAVPVGKDCLIWNAQRIYGSIRLPLLLKGWDLLDSFGFDENLFNISRDMQPVFVLKNKL